MRGKPFELHQGKERGFDVGGGKRKRSEGFGEPCSVLDQRRSLSPPTSTSTLSSSLGCGAAGGAAAAVSDSNNHGGSSLPVNGWPLSSSSDDAPSPADDERKLEWAADLLPIHPGFDMGAVAGERCTGLGVDDWEAMLGDSTGNEQTCLRWIMSDVEDPAAVKHQRQPLQQQQQQQQLFSSDFDTGTAGLGFGIMDSSSFGFEPLSGIDAAATLPGVNLNPYSNCNFSAGDGLPSAGGNCGKGFAAVHNTHGVGFSCGRLLNISNTQATGSPVLLPPAQVHNLASMPPGLFFNDEKPQLITPGGVLLNPSPKPAVFLPPPLLSASGQPEHGSGQIPMKAPFPDSSGGGRGGAQELFLRRNQAPVPQLQPVVYHLQHRSMKLKTGANESAAADTAAQQQQQQQAVVDQLFKVAGLLEAGNSVSARGILARLNHQLPSPHGSSLLRPAFYLKEALNLLLNSYNSHSTSPHRAGTPTTPLDVVLKLSAYKDFSEVSPVLQFTNFTSIQALLEEVGDSDRIHIVDFDIGVGGHWSSFMQELAQRRCTATANPSPMYLKITAYVSSSSHHPVELLLTHDNLTHFATDLNIPFEFNALPIESFDPTSFLASGADETIAVNLPMGSMLILPIPALLRLIKQLSPRIVISVDQGAYRNDLPFSHHILHVLQSSMVLLDSIDAAGAVPDVSEKFERYLLQPRIEAAVLGHHRAGEKMLPWRTIFTSLGFTPLQFSNFTETQAECLIKRVQVRGFHVEKRQGSLVLYWQRGELASVSAWR